MEPSPIANILSGLPLDRIVESYHSRQLGALSETELFRATAHVVSQPKLELGSFRLHAPLEIMARYNLLSLVSPADRDLARIQMVAAASHYQAGGEEIGPPERIQIGRSSAAAVQLRRAVQAGDIERADALCLSLADAGGLQGASGFDYGSHATHPDWRGSYAHRPDADDQDFQPCRPRSIEFGSRRRAIAGAGA